MCVKRVNDNFKKLPIIRYLKITDSKLEKCVKYDKCTNGSNLQF